MECYCFADDVRLFTPSKDLEYAIAHSYIAWLINSLYLRTYTKCVQGIFSKKGWWYNKAG